LSTSVRLSPQYGQRITHPSFRRVVISASNGKNHPGESRFSPQIVFLKIVGTAGQRPLHPFSRGSKTHTPETFLYSSSLSAEVKPANEHSVLHSVAMRLVVNQLMAGVALAAAVKGVDEKLRGELAKVAVQQIKLAAAAIEKSMQSLLK